MSNNLAPAGFRYAQIGLGLLVTTSTPNTVAALRAFPAIVMSASARDGCCTASSSRRMQTFWS